MMHLEFRTLLYASTSVGKYELVGKLKEANGKIFLHKQYIGQHSILVLLEWSDEN
jgi:hypothetical protein